MLRLAGASFLPAAFQQGSGKVSGESAAQLQDPRMAGMPRERITDYENDPFIIEIESGLACTCGCTLAVYTCRTTDFTCGVSPAMHREVVQLAQQGNNAEEIVAAFVARYGETVLLAPPKGGFNLVGYAVPGLGIFGVAAALLWMLVGRARSAASAVAAAADLKAARHEISQEDAALLEKELGDLDL